MKIIRLWNFQSFSKCSQKKKTVKSRKIQNRKNKQPKLSIMLKVDWKRLIYLIQHFKTIEKKRSRIFSQGLITGLFRVFLQSSCSVSFRGSLFYDTLKIKFWKISWELILCCSFLWLTAFSIIICYFRAGPSNFWCFFFFIL